MRASSFTGLAIRESPYKWSKAQELLLDSLADLCVKNSDERAAFTKLYDAMVLSERPSPEWPAWDALSLAYYGAGNGEASMRCAERARRLRLNR
jgi:hypothetical protein